MVAGQGLVAAAGFALHAAALGLGSVLLVLVSGTLWGLFAVPTKGVVGRLDGGTRWSPRTTA